LTQFDYLLPTHYTAEQGIAEGRAQFGSFLLNGELSKSTAVDGSALDPNAIAIPCGRFPGVFPLGTATFALQNGTTLPLETADLAYFSSSASNLNISAQWVDLTDPAFQSWL
jgi:hypothetical protein